jgi:hypothetical protein
MRPVSAGLWRGRRPCGTTKGFVRRGEEFMGFEMEKWEFGFGGGGEDQRRSGREEGTNREYFYGWCFVSHDTHQPAAHRRVLLCTKIVQKIILIRIYLLVYTT